MSMIVIFSEKPDQGTRIAATLGGCMLSSGVELTPNLLKNKQYEKAIKAERYKNGCFKGVIKNGPLKGKEYIQTWGFGHIAELKQAWDYDPKYRKWTLDIFPFFPPNYNWELKPMEGRTKEESKNIVNHLNRLKKWMNDPKVEFIVNACDADREGELIHAYVRELIGCKKPVKRLWISSTTEEAILKGFNNLKDESEMLTLEAAGRCRSIADLAIGGNGTAVTTAKYKGAGMISIGRVQTPTLALLVNRELEIRTFKPEDYYELQATFKADSGEYIGKWQKDKVDRFKSKAEAERIRSKIAGKSGTIIKAKNTKHEEKPPLLFDLTSLQGEANSRFGFSADKTLKIVQGLYENQFLTYPRTDSRYLSSDIKGEIPRIINMLSDSYKQFTDDIQAKPLKFTNRIINDSMVGSHHAIIPTYKKPSNLNPDEEKIYDLVARSLLAAFMENAVWGNTTLETQIDDEVFVTTGRMLLKEGWRAALGRPNNSDQELPLVTEGEVVDTQKLDVVKKQTRPPQRYSEKTLLNAMETAGKEIEDEELRQIMKKKGLGTPATRAEIIEKLIRVGYVTRKGKTLTPTEKGIQAIEVFPVDELKSAELTGEMEYKLSLVEKGELTKEEYLNEVYNFVRLMVDKIKNENSGQGIKGNMPFEKEVLGKCLHCGADVIETKKTYRCVNNKLENGTCDFVIFKDQKHFGKTLTKANVKQLLRKGETNIIKGLVSPRTNKKFEGKFIYKKGERFPIQLKPF